MAPAAPRLGERPTVASVVRRRLFQAGRDAVGPVTSHPGTHAEDLACGHPAHQAHVRFHPFHGFAARKLARG
jgi:hypothetical protein